MEIVIISPEENHPNERMWLIKLFEAGLSRFHFRKPSMNDDEVEIYLKAIPLEWRDRVVIHQSFRLVNPLNLGGWHFRDDIPQLRQAERINKSLNRGKTLSRSIHSLEDLKIDMRDWDYVFLSPIFRSISKRDYGPRWKESQLLAVIDSCKDTFKTRVYALGGVDVTKIKACAKMGFDGVALHGAIWEAPDPLQAFLKIKAALKLLK